MDADKAAELVTRKRREYGLPPISLTEPQRQAAFQSLGALAVYKRCSLETAIDMTVKMHYQSHLLGRPL